MTDKIDNDNINKNRYFNCLSFVKDDKHYLDTPYNGERLIIDPDVFKIEISGPFSGKTIENAAHKALEYISDKHIRIHKICGREFIYCMYETIDGEDKKYYFIGSINNYTEGYYEIKVWNLDYYNQTHIDYSTCRPHHYITRKYECLAKCNPKQLINYTKFYELCRDGLLYQAIKMYEENKDIDIHKNDDESFRYACSNGHLEVAKWLYSLDGKVNINIYKQFALKNACLNGHLEVAKWLYSFDNKIDSENYYDYDNAFINAFNNGHLDIVNWMISLCDRYYVEIQDKQIIYKIYRDCLI